MRVADIKRRMTAARKFASNAKPPSAKPKKHKRLLQNTVERGSGIIQSDWVANERCPAVTSTMQKQILGGSRIITDAARSFARAPTLGKGYTHRHCNHSGMLGKNGAFSM